MSDININTSTSKQAYQEFLTTSRGKLRPIPFRETQQEGATGWGVESSSTSGKNKLANMFSTALYSALDGNLIHIKLTIKGDPYWMFPRPMVLGQDKIQFKADMPVEDAMRELQRIHETTNSVNLFGTDNFIIVRFRTPRIYNETMNPDNPDPFTEVETFSGVYRVLSIISKFEMGKFSQELNCQLDPVINTSDFIELIEKNAATLDIPATVQDLAGAKVVPVTAIKTQKTFSGLSTTISNAGTSFGNQINGVADTVRNAAGQVTEFGSATVGQVINAGKSNVPALPTPDLIARAKTIIPPTFLG